MSELEQVITWLRTYEGHDILKDWHVDYTDQVPSCGAVFPQGLQEIERRTYITGAVCVTNQSNFGLYFTFAKSAGDDEGAKINADWVNDFQHWVQEQSTHGLAPNFGDAEESVIARAQNGVLYEAEAEGTATYMVVLSLRYTKTYESEDFAYYTLPGTPNIPTAPSTLYSAINDMEQVLWSLHELWQRNSVKQYAGEICAGQEIGVI